MIVWSRGRIIATSLGVATVVIGAGLTIVVMQDSFNAPVVPPYKADPEEQRQQLVAVSAPFSDCAKSKMEERWRTATDINEIGKEIIQACRKDFELVRAVQRQNMKNGPNPRDASREDEERLRAIAVTSIGFEVAKRRCADNLPTPQANCDLLNRSNRPRH